MKRDSKDNPLWQFLTSIKLAVTLLITLAITSIAGTVIPQGEPLQNYLEHYGPTMFRVIKTLHLYDTYHSWWYLSLLGLFSINLISCTLKRLPFTLKLYKKDALDTAPERLSRMPFRASWEVNPGLDGDRKESIVSSFSKHAGGVNGVRDVAAGKLYLSERGKWSHWGLYGLHASILVILIGAIIGTFTGFKGFIMLMEGDSTDHVFDSRTNKPIPLGFTLRCDSFTVSFYDTGAPKEFRSDLTILDNGKEVLSKALRVNSPISYKGITFYQASYQAVPKVTFRVAASDGRLRTFTVPTFQKVVWPETGLALGVLKYMPNIHGMPAARIWVQYGSGPAQAVWVLKGHDKEIQLGKDLFRLSLLNAQERYMTGLQIKKDPGVWVVWLGCTALILGFTVVFWVPHRKMWLWIGRSGKKEMILLAGQSNKNKLQFEQDFNKVKEVLDQQIGDGS